MQGISGQVAEISRRLLLRVSWSTHSGGLNHEAKWRREFFSVFFALGDELPSIVQTLVMGIIRQAQLDT